MQDPASLPAMNNHREVLIVICDQKEKICSLATLQSTRTQWSITERNEEMEVGSGSSKEEQNETLLKSESLKKMQ